MTVCGSTFFGYQCAIVHVGGKIIESEAGTIRHASVLSAKCVQGIDNVGKKYLSVLFSIAERKKNAVKRQRLGFA